MEEKIDDNNPKKKTELGNSFEMKETSGKEKMDSGYKF
jgi:hypothetical protein